MNLQAIIFDLDGVITDTAEYHYLAWQRLADEEGLPFDRQINECLRGIGRRESLEIILAGRPVTEAAIAEMTDRKNRYYVALLEQVTPADMLPGALYLLHELRAAGIKIGIGSVSKNTPTVIERLGIGGLLDAVADGRIIERSKPAPDVFLKAAELLSVSPAACAVIEDATAGIDAALAAGMWAIGLGPVERVGHAHLRFESLDRLTLADIRVGLEAASWTVAESAFNPAAMLHKETVFTTGNGNLCVRGCFEEGYPGENAASFMHRLWDDMPINITELANLPRWWGVDIWANGVRFRLDHPAGAHTEGAQSGSGSGGKVLSYRRWLDLRSGVLSRTVRWQPAEGGPVLDLSFERFVSLADPYSAAINVQVALVSGRAELRLRTGLDTHVENTGLVHWNLVTQEVTPDAAAVQVRTRATGSDLVVAMAVSMSGTVPWQPGMCDADGQPAIERHATLRAGDNLTLQKFVAIVPGFDAEDPLATALAGARRGQAEGYSGWRAANDAEWAKLWDVSGVVVEGDNEAQLAIRFNIFQLLIAAPRYTDRASIGAKTLSGFGYRHHAFWDTEIFMLPLFSYTQPELAQNMLMYRWHNLPGARAKAAGNGYDGAQFPWESAGDGREVTPTWVTHFADPTQLVRIWTGDIEIHITADVAYGIMQYWRVTGDDRFMADYGAEMILDGASFWASAAQHEADGKYHYRNVIGPDEYHDRINDNAYTNHLAKWHLETALDVLAWLQREHPARAHALIASLDLSPARLAHWTDVIMGMYLSDDSETGLIEQFAGYFDLTDADQSVLRDPRRTRSMQALLDIEGCAATQNLKQPDVLMLQYLLPERFSSEQVRANYDYYAPRTDHEHGSSLGPSISAIMACRVGECDLGYQHFLRAARADLLDVRHNAGDGIHGASAGGLWQAVVFGFAGLQLSGHTKGAQSEGWEIRPMLPAGWTRLAFKFYYRGELRTVDIRG